MKDKIERLENVLSSIELYSRNEYHFQTLYDILREEYENKGGRTGKGVYWNNLRQTIQKQASSYMSAKSRRPKKGAPDEYDEFIMHFRMDVSNELTSLKLQNGSKL